MPSFRIVPMYASLRVNADEFHAPPLESTLSQLSGDA
jgi:hypothetical protein